MRSAVAVFHVDVGVRLRIVRCLLLLCGLCFGTYGFCFGSRLHEVNFSQVSYLSPSPRPSEAGGMFQLDPCSSVTTLSPLCARFTHR